MNVSERAMMRIREEMTERKLSQRDLAQLLRCSQGRVAKMLNGGVHLRLSDLAILAEAVGIPLVEAVRDRGLEFFAELTPTEVRILERLRRRPEVIPALGVILGLKPDLERPKLPLQPSAKRRRGRPLNSEQMRTG